MKKVISVFVIMVMVLSLVACGGSGGDETDSSSNTDSATDATTDTTATDDTSSEDAAASGDDNTLTVWCWDPAFNINAMEKAEAIYQQENPDFKLNIVETPWEDLQTKLTTAASSGQLDTLPDIFLMQDNAFQKNVISFPDVFVDLTNMDGIDFSQFAPAKAGFSSVDGKNYGVPFDNGAAIAAYRTDVLEEAGYSLDDFTDITWDEYLEMGKDILAKTGKPLLSGLAGESDVIVMMLQSAGGSFFDENGDPFIVGNEVLETVAEQYLELVEAGVLIEVNDWDQYIASFNNGTVAGTINGAWIMASIQAAEDQAGNWGITNLPKLEGLSAATNYSTQGGSSWAVTTNSDNPELAADFLGRTFGGSVEFYEQILPTGALSTYLPAADSDAYTVPSDFFGGQEVFALITDYAGRIPQSNTGVYFYEARDAVATAITTSVHGGDLQSELQVAQDTLSFAMGR
jgi:lactose/L-arabinose transport system substrate-binding protein